MELWIRIQCRYRLIKVDDIIVRDNDLWYESEKGGLLLGNYKDEKRALEVLDEIQDKLLLPNIHFNGTYEQGMANLKLIELQNQRIVYEMPKE